jgi:hypothetical protein
MESVNGRRASTEGSAKPSWSAFDRGFHARHPGATASLLGSCRWQETENHHGCGLLKRTENLVRLSCESTTTRERKKRASSVWRTRWLAARASVAGGSGGGDRQESNTRQRCLTLASLRIERHAQILQPTWQAEDPQTRSIDRRAGWKAFPTTEQSAQTTRTAVIAVATRIRALAHSLPES